MSDADKLKQIEHMCLELRRVVKPKPFTFLKILIGDILGIINGDEDQ